MPKATLELDSASAVATPNAVMDAPAILEGNGKLVRLSLDQIILDPITDVRTGPVSRDEESKIDSLARTMFEQGQLQPVVVRPDGEPGKYLLIAGRRRYAAAQLIAQKTSAPWDLDAFVVAKNDEEAYSAAIQENLQRRQFSPIELATQITEIRKRMGWNDADWTKHVAEFLHVSRATVSQHAKLLDLPAKIQTKVHNGLLSAQSAFDLASVEESQREAVLAKAEALAEADPKPTKSSKSKSVDSTSPTSASDPEPAETGKIKRKHILAAARESDAITTTKPRTRNEILAFFSGIVESTDSYSEPVVKFCENLVNKWATGQVSDRSLLNRLNDINELCEDKASKAKPAKKTAAVGK